VSEAGGAPDAFERLRPGLRALACRMLGDPVQADDVVVEAWLRWQLGGDRGLGPAAALAGLVFELCRRELAPRETRGDARDGGCAFAPATLDRVSMALVSVVCRLSPSERAVFLLRDVFRLSDADVAAFLSASETHCRRLHRRAREDVAWGRKILTARHEEHSRLLGSALEAAESADVPRILATLCEAPVLIAEGYGARGASAEGRGPPAALSGREKVASLVAALGRKSPRRGLERVECSLNGEPAILLLRGGQADAALLVSVADGKISQIFVHGDPFGRGDAVASERRLRETV
jgi:RNA polymerase sigma-70 factor (ECF subfamily)